MAPSDQKPNPRREDADLTPTPSEVTPTPLASPRGGDLPKVSGADPALAPGTELDGRYRIVRFIAAGGMGEVYEATDEALGAKIALKTIRPEVVARETVMERFHREIVLARRVTHPLVCRIFDLGSHPVPNGPPVAFLTMELLPGRPSASTFVTTDP